MAWNRKLLALVLLVSVAVAGYSLRSFVPNVLAEYEQARSFHPVWGYIYLAVLGLSAAAFLTLVLWGVWTLLSNSRFKADRRAAAATSPSQMSRRRAAGGARRATGRGTHAGRRRHAVGRSPRADPPLARRPDKQDRKADARNRGLWHRLERQVVGAQRPGRPRRVSHRSPGGTTVNRNEIPWPGVDRVVLVDTPGLAEINGAEREELAKRAARDADLVLFVTDGPLKDFEFQFVEQLAAMEKRIVLCLNKEDWFRPADRDRAGRPDRRAGRGAWCRAENVVALRAQPAARIRTRVLADGSQSDEAVEVEPDIRALADRMQAIVSRDGRDLLLANLLLAIARAGGRSQSARAIRTRQAGRRRSSIGPCGRPAPRPRSAPCRWSTWRPDWASLRTWCCNWPACYRQKIDLDTISRLLGELGKQLLSVAGANVAAPAAASAIASLLKTVPGVGTITGGVLQGLVQVLVTRWIGGVFIVYFRERDARRRRPAGPAWRGPSGTR